MKNEKLTEKTKIIEQTAMELLGLLKIDRPEIVVGEDEEGTVRVNIQTPDSALLIGYHGQTLGSFQLILSLIIYKKLGVWQKIVVDVGDYRERREAELTQMAVSLATQVKETNKPAVLPYLSPNERRIVHLSLSGDPAIITYSEGEGRYRRLVIAPADATPAVQEPSVPAKEPGIAG